MNTQPSMTFIERNPHNDEVYRYIRSEIQFELNLINARVNWLIASQAFLFVPLVVGIQGKTLTSSLFFPFIPHLGILLCVLVFIAVLAAVWRSLQWRVKYSQGAYSGIDEHGVFSIVVPHTPLIPLMGMVGALAIPIVLAGAWMYVRIWPPGLPG